jgi:hypothetical protein
MLRIFDEIQGELGQLHAKCRTQLVKKNELMFYGEKGRRNPIGIWCRIRKINGSSSGSRESNKSFLYCEKDESVVCVINLSPHIEREIIQDLLNAMKKETGSRSETITELNN